MSAAPGYECAVAAEWLQRYARQIMRRSAPAMLARTSVLSRRLKIWRLASVLQPLARGISSRHAILLCMLPCSGGQGVLLLRSSASHHLLSQQSRRRACCSSQSRASGRRSAGRESVSCIMITPRETAALERCGDHWKIIHSLLAGCQKRPARRRRSCGPAATGPPPHPPHHRPKAPSRPRCARWRPATRERSY